MIVVSDTTPIISLLKINKLNLLEKLFGEVVIPKGVFSELTDNPLYKNEAESVQKSEFIKIVDTIDENYVALLRRSTGLDLGESEAIYISDNEKESLLLMDELRGREVAARMGIRIMGTIGILMSAYKNNLLTKNEIENSIDILKDNGRHISEKLYNQLIDLINS